MTETRIQITLDGKRLLPDVVKKCNNQEIIISTPRSKRNIKVELYNCDLNYLRQVRKVICIHPADHSIALFLKMKSSSDLCLYCHSLLSNDKAKQFVISYTSQYNFPLVILTRIEDIKDLFKENGVPTIFRRWCSRVFKIEPTRLFYKTFIPSGVIEYMGMQKFQSKKRGEMNPELIEDAKSQKRYKIFRQLPIFHDSEEDNTKTIKNSDIKPFNDSRGYKRYGCDLCPFAGEQYYKDLKEEDKERYKWCEELMEIASAPNERYYYYKKSKIM